MHALHIVNSKSQNQRIRCGKCIGPWGHWSQKIFYVPRKYFKSQQGWNKIQSKLDLQS
jgi:hypothetical protein